VREASRAFAAARRGAVPARTVSALVRDTADSPGTAGAVITLPPKEDNITRRIATPVAQRIERMKAAPVITHVKGRYSEKALHIPADLSVIVLSVSALASAGIIVLAVVALIAAIGLLVFSA
jgi:hypothetical protein